MTASDSLVIGAIRITGRLPCQPVGNRASILMPKRKGPPLGCASCERTPARQRRKEAAPCGEVCRVAKEESVRATKATKADNPPTARGGSKKEIILAPLKRAPRRQTDGLYRLVRSFGPRISQRQGRQKDGPDRGVRQKRRWSEHLLDCEVVQVRYDIAGGLADQARVEDRADLITLKIVRH